MRPPPCVSSRLTPEPQAGSALGHRRCGSLSCPPGRTPAPSCVAFLFWVLGYPPRPGPPCFSVRAAHALRCGLRQQGVHPQVSGGPWFAAAAAASTWRAPSSLGVGELRFLGSPEAALLTSPPCARQLPGGWAMVAEVTTTDGFCSTSPGGSVTLPGQCVPSLRARVVLLSPRSGPVPALGTWADRPG